MATTASGWPWPLMGPVTKQMEKHKDKLLTWAHGDSPGPNDRWKIQPHPCWAPFRKPVCCWNAAARRPKIFRMGGSASCCDLFTQQRSHSPHSKTAESIKEKTAHSKASTPYLRPIGIREYGSPPLQLGGISTNLAISKVGEKEPQIWSGL